MKPVARIVIRKNEFNRIAAQYPRKVNQVNRLFAARLIEQAEPRTPRNTGALAERVYFEELSETLIEIYWEMEYAIFQELGTRYIAPKFFATGAVEEVRDYYVDAIRAIDLLA